MRPLASFAAANADWAQALQHVDIEAVLQPVLIQLAVILVTARLFAVLFRKLGQPSVVGEIAAGLVLGPSVLGYLFPSVAAAVFHPSIADLPPELADALLNRIFGVISHIGLIFLLFLVGLEFDFSHLRWHGKAALAISATGVAVPFVLGLGLAALLWPHLEPHPGRAGPVPEFGFMLFLGVALAITAIPVLARMMMELNITATRLGTITIAAAAADDATGWILLAAVAAVVRAEFSAGATIFMAVQTVLFVLAMVFIVRPALRWWVGRLQGEGRTGVTLNSLAMLVAFIFVAAIVTNLIGIFAIFGAFLTGAILSGAVKFKEAAASRLRDLVTVFFVPIFFTYTGLRTDIGTLTAPLMWLFCALVLIVAVAGKLGGCGLAARLSGFPRREATCVGVLMNTRGLVELVVVNLGYDLRVIPPSVYCMLVIMALVTTAMTTPLLLRLMPGTELEPYIRRSDFAAPGGEIGPAPLPDLPEIPAKIVQNQPDPADSPKQ